MLAITSQKGVDFCKLKCYPKKDLFSKSRDFAPKRPQKGQKRRKMSKTGKVGKNRGKKFGK
jgi:hypothetical protein